MPNDGLNDRLNETPTMRHEKTLADAHAAVDTAAEAAALRAEMDERCKMIALGVRAGAKGEQLAASLGVTPQEFLRMKRKGDLMLAAP